MFDNFVQEKYHSYDRVFTHPVTGHAIFIGDVQAALDLDFLMQNKIHTVVTAARDMDQVKYGSDILHIVYPLLDGKNEDITSFFDNFFQLIENNISQGSVLVHCAAGISRSSTLVISYIMKLQSLTFRQAIAHVRQHRPSVLPNLGFERQLKRYEETLQESRTPRRGISKTAQSSGHQLQAKTQLLPSFDLLKPKRNRLQIRNIPEIDKIKNREANVMRIYHSKEREGQFRVGNTSKHKKFVITKKAASFSRQPDNKALMISALRSQQPREYFLPKFQKHLASLQKMKAIYLTKKGIVERRNTNTTERSGTFYNVGVNKPQS